MPEVSVTRSAANLGARLPQRVVLEQGDSLGVDRLVERRPPAVAVEFGSRREQLCSATAAGVEAGTVFFKKLSRPRPFRSRFAQDVESFGRENLAPLVFGSFAGVVRHAPH